MQLIIVESPSKAKTIEKYLGGKYKVDASGGHIRDLPEKRLGVNVANNYEPNYVVSADKKPIIKRLKEKVEKGDLTDFTTLEHNSITMSKEESEKYIVKY